jgi:hypothetical protein
MQLLFYCSPASREPAPRKSWLEHIFRQVGTPLALLCWGSLMSEVDKFLFMAHKLRECAEEALSLAETFRDRGPAFSCQNVKQRRPVLMGKRQWMKADPNDILVSHAEKLELALCLKSALESRDAQVIAVIWPNSTLQIRNVKRQFGISRQS